MFMLAELQLKTVNTGKTKTSAMLPTLFMLHNNPEFFRSHVKVTMETTVQGKRKTETSLNLALVNYA